MARAKNAHEAKPYILAATARILILQQKFDEAYNLSKEALGLAPNDPVLQAQMGWAEVYKENEKNGLDWLYKYQMLRSRFFYHLEGASSSCAAWVTIWLGA